MQIYVVKSDDTLDTIAASFGLSPEIIAYTNQILSPYRLAVGQALLIPAGSSEEEKTGVYVNGYAYPYIRDWVLTETLPYLTTLSVFSYGFTTTGELVPPAVNDDWMIDKAWQQGVRPILTLTPMPTPTLIPTLTLISNNHGIKETLIYSLCLRWGDRPENAYLC